jgi:SAM-dependent methyltransferase
MGISLVRAALELRLSLARRLLGHGKPKPAGYWDRSFAAGDWDHLGSRSESLRFVVLSSLLEHHCPSEGRILDVGCGQATLAGHLGPAASRYVGVDVSAEAVAKARCRAPEGTPLFVACGDAPVCGGVADLGPYGAIVFSEVLYYLREPLETLARHQALLRPDGLIFISLWNPSRHRALRARLARRMEIVASVVVGTGTPRPWLLLVCRSHPPPIRRE